MNLSKVIDIKKAYLLIALLLSSIVSFSQEKEPAILIKDSTKVPVVKKISRYDSAMQAIAQEKQR